MDQPNPYAPQPDPNRPDPQQPGPHQSNPGQQGPHQSYPNPQGGYPSSGDPYRRSDEYVEHTRPMPQYQGPGPQYPMPPQRPRGRGLAAGVLAGALVLGGAAGVGGAAAYTAFNDDGGNGSGSSSGPFETTKTAAVKDGTVEKVAASVLPSVVKVNVVSDQGEGSGSGIVLSEDGKILTNNHVVAGAGQGARLSVSFNDGTTKRATVVGTDPLVDVAVIEVEGASDLKPASLGKSGDLQVGQTVVAVGSPFGLNATVTSGIVSALHRPVSVSSQQEQPQNPFEQAPEQDPGQGRDLSTTYPAIQTDAAINPGNSGGPLLDMSGRVVGINSSIRTASSGLGTGGGGSIGLGFAIPIDEVLPIVNQITDGQKPTHARLGVSVSNVGGDTLAQGAQVRSVDAGGAGAKAGLKNGDVITKVGDHAIDSSESLVATIRGHRPGEEVEITYVRDGKTRTITAKLGSDAQNSDS